MSGLHLYFHPLASYCWKALIALYENETPFTPHVIDLGDAAQRAELAALWPVTKFPVLRDEATNRVVPEAAIIVEYLAQHHPGRTQLVPADPDLARQTRLHDRFYDLYVADPMSKIVTDRIRPTGKNDPFGVEQARALLRTSLKMVDDEMATKAWAMGDAFGMADCAAGPALYYANEVMPFGETHRHARAYLQRLKDRPSFARVLREAEPYFAMFPRDR
jgi:glutathione S-transferase